MILINRKETNPYFNIAAEEYVLKNFEEEVFMLWVNRPSVIVGKHQVATAEADILYTWEHDIPVIRRISGGGTVYHDEGNLNYSLISRGERGKLVDYLKYAGTVIRALKKLSVKAELQGKSSLYTAGKKFSGNAEHVYRNRVLHHGTLLFNTDAEMLRQCIRPAHNGYADRSIRSVDSITTNLMEYFPPGFSLESFRTLLLEQAYEDFPDIRSYTFSEHDLQAISELVNKKYSAKEWNFGYSPKYSMKSKIDISGRKITFEMDTEKGKIVRLKIKENDTIILTDLADALHGVIHHPESVSEILNKFNFAGYGIPADKLMEGIF